MPTQEERVEAVEHAVAAAQTFQRDAAAHIRETEENTTIMLGVIRSQGQDIKRTVQRLETIDERLDRMETLLTQILARLPEKP